MRALLPLLVACGGGTSPAPDASVPSAHYVLDFTFGTNGEALVTPTIAPTGSLALVITPVGLAIATSGATTNSVCLANLHGKIDSTFGTGGCATLSGAVGHDSVVADGAFVTTVDPAHSTLTHVDAHGVASAAVALPLAATHVWVEDKDTTFVAGSDNRAAYITDDVPSTAMGLENDGYAINDLFAGPTFVGTDQDGHAFALETIGNLASKGNFDGPLMVANAPPILQGYIDGEGVIALTATAVERLDKTGAIDMAFGVQTTSSAPLSAAVLSPMYVAVSAGSQLIVLDHAGHVSTDLDPLPAANAPVSLLSLVATSEGGFIAAGFTANGKSVALVHYVPQ